MIMVMCTSATAHICEELGIEQRILLVVHVGDHEQSAESDQDEHDDEEELGDVRKGAAACLGHHCCFRQNLSQIRSTRGVDRAWEGSDNSCWILDIYSLLACIFWYFCPARVLIISLTSSSDLPSRKWVFTFSMFLPIWLTKSSVSSILCPSTFYLFSTNSNATSEAALMTDILLLAI